MGRKKDKETNIRIFFGIRLLSTKVQKDMQTGLLLLATMIIQTLVSFLTQLSCTINCLVCQVVDIVRSLASRNIEQSVESFASHIFASCGTTFHDSPSTAFTTPAYTTPSNPNTEPTTTEATTTEGSGGGGNESERDESESESESEESESESESERDESESESERDESECQESEGEGSEGEETKI